MPDDRRSLIATRSAHAGGAWHVLSQTAEYALRAVLYIGGRGEGQAVPVSDVAGALGVPEKYLARVLNTLRRTGTLRSKRGAQGGFWLTRPAGSVRLMEVVAPFEPAGEVRPCLLRGHQCGSQGGCSAHDVWQSLAAHVRGFFERTTIADLLPAEPQVVAANNRVGSNEMEDMKEKIPQGMTVNEAVRVYPATIAVFKRFGIDACCGGACVIEEAAERDGADVAALMKALERAMESCPSIT